MSELPSKHINTEEQGQQSINYSPIPSQTPKRTPYKSPHQSHISAIPTSTSLDSFEVIDEHTMNRGVQCSLFEEGFLQENANKDAELALLRRRLNAYEVELRSLRNSSEQVSVSEYYSGKTLYITGATGFVGTLVLEKILRVAPNVAKIFVLVRPRKGKTPEERMTEMVNTAAFDLLRKQLGDYFDGFVRSKVVLVAGDISVKNFAMSDKDLNVVRKEVNVIIHSAASIRFNLPLDEAINLNYRPVQQLMRIAKDCPNLLGIVQVSSAYVNVHLPHNSRVLEKVYPCGIDRDRAIDVCSSVTKEQATSYGERLAAKFHYPNTYTMTKHWGELHIEEEVGALGIPIAIVRPSIICPVLRDPVKGWVGNRSGLSGAVLGMASGFLDFLPARPEICLDIIPGDLVANTILAAGANLPKQTTSLSVYHSCSSGYHPLALSSMHTHIANYFTDNPLPQEYRIKKVTPGAFRFLSSVGARWVYRMKALKIGMYKILLRLKGDDKAIRRADKGPSLLREFMTLEAFTSHGWNFEVTNTQRMQAELSDLERYTMPLLPEGINWREYLWLTCEGVSSFLLPTPIRHGVERVRKSTVDVVNHGVSYARALYASLGLGLVVIIVAIILFFVFR